MANEFWFNDQQWANIEPLLPKNRPGARRVDDRRVLSGIVHVLKRGCRWRDCPTVYGPPTTIYNRFRRWTMQGVWRRLFAQLAQVAPGDAQMIDSTSSKAHRCAAGGKGGATSGDWALARRQDNEDPCRRRWQWSTDSLRDYAGAARRRPCRRYAARAFAACLPICAADAAYDSKALRQFLTERGTLPVIPNNPTRKNPHLFDRQRYRQRNLIERMFCRLKDWRRVHIRYDKLADTFTATVYIAAESGP